MIDRRILVIGATSAVGEQAARLWASPSTHFDLVARDKNKLLEVAADLNARGAKTTLWPYDIRDPELHESALPTILQGGFNIVFCSHGLLGDTDRAENDSKHAAEILEVNMTSTVLLLNQIAKSLGDRQTAATIAVITSVAGDRGRQSNYFYGAAKGGLSIFLAGLRNRYAKRHIHVLTVKPGFIATPMTKHLPQNKLYVSPEYVAAQIVKAVARQRDVIYVPGIWRLIMMIIRCIPETIFKRLSL